MTLWPVPDRRLPAIAAACNKPASAHQMPQQAAELGTSPFRSLLEGDGPRFVMGGSIAHAE